MTIRAGQTEWRTLSGSPRDWVTTAPDGVQHVECLSGSSYLISETEQTTGDFQLRTGIKIGEPRYGVPSPSVDVLFNAVDHDNTHLARLRVRNGVRYLTVAKRIDGSTTVLFDDIFGFNFDEWIDVGIARAGHRVEISIDGESAATCFEKEPPAGTQIGIGVTGAIASFGTTTVTRIGTEHSQVSTVRDYGSPVRSFTQACHSRSVAATVENRDYRLRFIRLTLPGGPSYVVEIEVRSGAAWLPISGLGQWVVLRGDNSADRSDLHGSMSRHWVTFDNLQLVDPTTVRLNATNDEFDLTITWRVSTARPTATISLTPASDGHHVVAYHAFDDRQLDDITEVLCGPLQHAKMVRGPESIGTAELSAPVNLVERPEQGSNVTVGVFVPAGELPFEYEPSKGDDAQVFGMSLRNDRGAVQPVIFTPQLGRHSLMTAGATYEFTCGIYASHTELFEAYRELVRDEYGYGRYRRNVFGASLTDTMHNLIDLLRSRPPRDDSEIYQASPGGWWGRAKGFIDIENDQAVRATTTAVLLGAYYLTADDDLYEDRARPIIEFHLSRNSYGWTPRADKTIYGVPHNHRMCGTPLGAPALGPLSSLTRGQMPVIKHLALQASDDEDYWLKRSPMISPLAAYRTSGDPAHLERAESNARAYVSREVAQPYTTNVDPHDFASYYSKAWIDLLEMYETTRDASYLDAAYTEAKRFVTQVFVRPVPSGSTTVPTRPLFIDRQIEMTGWWDPDALYDYPDRDVPDEVAANWILSPTGLGFEALKTYRHNGFTMNPAWAPFLLRLAGYVGDDLLRDIAHNAVTGRFTTYPGYYYRQFSVNHLKPDFAKRGPFGNTTIYYHHAPVQLGLTIDYLIAEHQSRAAGNIAFPAEYEQNYVWFAFHVYGHKPGHFYGHDDVWLWMPKGIVTLDNPGINWITAKGNGRFFVSLTNSATTTERVRVTLDAQLLGLEPEREYAATVIADNTDPVSTSVIGHELDVTVPGLGITAIIIDDIGELDIALHVEPDPIEDDLPSYHFDDLSEVGAVRGMLLVKPDRSCYHAYVQAAAEEPATLHYSTDDGAKFTSWPSHVYPYEWTVRVDDLTTPFRYFIQIGDHKSAPVRLSVSSNA